MPVIAVKPFARNAEGAFERLRQESVDILEADDDTQAGEWARQVAGCVLVLWLKGESELRRYVEWMRILKAPIQQRRVRLVLVCGFDAQGVLESLEPSGGFAEAVKDPVSEKALHHKIEHHLRAVIPVASKLLASRSAPGTSRIENDFQVVKRLIQEESGITQGGAPVGDGATRAEGAQTLSPLALGFLISELVAKPRETVASAAALASRASGYLSGACAGARVELWKREADGSWGFVGGAREGKPASGAGVFGARVAALDDDEVRARQGYQDEGDAILTVVPVREWGALVVESAAMLPLEYVRACGAFFAGLASGKSQAA